MKAFVEGLFPEYEYVSSLGENKLSGSCLVQDKSSQNIKYSVKLIFIEGITEANLNAMVARVQKFQEVTSPYLLRIVNSAYNKQKSHFAIVSEFARGGNLAAEISQISHAKRVFMEDDIWEYTIQICWALQALHKEGLIHRSIKSTNIFLSEDKKSLRLGDIGFYDLLEPEKRSQYDQYPQTQSPEYFQGKYNMYQSDLWSLGCIIYEMMAQQPPFQSRDTHELQRKILAANFPSVQNVPKNLVVLVQHLLTAKIADRPELKQIMKFVAQAQYKGGQQIEKLISPKRKIKPQVFSQLSNSVFGNTPPAGSFSYEYNGFLPKIEQNNSNISYSSSKTNNNNHNSSINESSQTADFQDKFVKHPFRPQPIKLKKPTNITNVSPKRFTEDSMNHLDSTTSKQTTSTAAGNNGNQLSVLLQPFSNESKSQILMHSPKPLSVNKKQQEQQQSRNFTFPKRNPSAEQPKESRSIQKPNLISKEPIVFTMEKDILLSETKRKAVSSSLNSQVSLMRKFGSVSALSSEYSRQKQEQRHIVFMTDVARVVKQKQTAPSLPK